MDFEAVSFSYLPEKPLIEGFQLSVQPRASRVAIVGPTGCGKTTLINLLMRFYDVNSGTHLAWTAPTSHTVPRAALRRNFGMVLQETWLRHATVRDNIRMGRPRGQRRGSRGRREGRPRPQPSSGGCPRATTPSSPRTAAASPPGQKQLLCIARIMLLPAAHADSGRGHLLHRHPHGAADSAGLRPADAGPHQSFIVAHRLSTIQEADVILVMRDGSIVEQGNHQSLLAQDGFYAQLYRSQFTGA